MRGYLEEVLFVHAGALGPEGGDVLLDGGLLLGELEALVLVELLLPEELDELLAVDGLVLAPVRVGDVEVAVQPDLQQFLAMSITCPTLKLLGIICELNRCFDCSSRFPLDRFSSSCCRFW